MSPTSYHCSTPRHFTRHDIRTLVFLLRLILFVLRPSHINTIFKHISDFDLRSSKLVGRDGFEPSYLTEQIYSLSPLTTRPPAHYKFEALIIWRPQSDSNRRSPA